MLMRAANVNTAYVPFVNTAYVPFALGFGQRAVKDMSIHRHGAD
jgi:hypothetical protein